MKKTYTLLEHQLLCLVQQLMDDYEETQSTIKTLVEDCWSEGCHDDAHNLLHKHPCEQERREDPVLLAKLEEKEKARLAEEEATKNDMG